MGADDEKKEEDNQEAEGWQYKPGAGSSKAAAQSNDTPPEHEGSGTEIAEWTASEFIAHEKGRGWYVILFCVTAIVAAVIYFATRDMFSVIVVLIMAMIFGISSTHKPKVINYKLDSSGMTVGNKFYPYAAYKSFSMAQQGPFKTIELMPMKRLAFPVGAFLAPESQEEVLHMISEYLPLEHKEPGTVDRLMHELRF